MTININGVNYKFPASVSERNAQDETQTYNTLFLKEVFTGREDWERIENDGGDWLNDSELFGVYGAHHNVDGDEVDLNLVGDAMYAVFMNYDEDEYEIHLLEVA